MKPIVWRAPDDEDHDQADNARPTKRSARATQFSQEILLTMVPQYVIISDKCEMQRGVDVKELILVYIL